MGEEVVIIAGVRTPFCKSSGRLRHLEADVLGAIVVRELLARTNLTPVSVDELVFGNVLQPPNATNVARVLAVKGGLPVTVPAVTVNRNCASGMEAIVTAAQKIQLGKASIVIAGGTESMSHSPLLFSEEMRDWLRKKRLFSLRPRFFKPYTPAIADPLCGLNMGQTAEVLAREFQITRAEQDEYALLSQQRAADAIRRERFQQEIVPTFSGKQMETQDDGVRPEQTLAELQALSPAFEKLAGTVTAGNSSQITDGACALLLMSASKAKALGLYPIGKIIAEATAALEPSRMGLGPAFATAKLLRDQKINLSDIDLIEMNEAFAAQIIANERAFPKDPFNLGVIDREKLNVNGGAIALGHPVGASGARLVLTLCQELQNRDKSLGLATLCVGGGQGEALLISRSA